MKTKDARLSLSEAAAKYLGSVEVAADGSPVQRRSAASVRAVYGSSCLQKEMDDANMVGTRSPEAG